MTYTRKTLPEQSYLYIDKQCPYGPQIAQEMAAGFKQLYEFMGQKSITALSMPMSVYTAMDKSVLRFRAAAIVNPDDVAHASGDIKAATLPVGECMHTVHIGAYDTVGETHKNLWAYMKDHNIAQTMPIWEIYLDDPQTTDAEKLRTEIYCAIA